MNLGFIPLPTPQEWVHASLVEDGAMHQAHVSLGSPFIFHRLKISVFSVPIYSFCHISYPCAFSISHADVSLFGVVWRAKQFHSRKEIRVGCLCLTAMCPKRYLRVLS